MNFINAAKWSVLFIVILYITVRWQLPVEVVPDQVGSIIENSLPTKDVRRLSFDSRLIPNDPRCRDVILRYTIGKDESGAASDILLSFQCDLQRVLALEALRDARPQVRYLSAMAWSTSLKPLSEADETYVARMVEMINDGRFPSDIHFGSEGELYREFRRFIHEEGLLIDVLAKIDAVTAAKVAYNHAIDRLPVWTEWIGYAVGMGSRPWSDCMRRGEFAVRCERGPIF